MKAYKLIKTNKKERQKSEKNLAEVQESKVKMRKDVDHGVVTFHSSKYKKFKINLSTSTLKILS